MTNESQRYKMVYFIKIIEKIFTNVSYLLIFRIQISESKCGFKILVNKYFFNDFNKLDHLRPWLSFILYGFRLFFISITHFILGMKFVHPFRL